MSPVLEFAFRESARGETGKTPVPPRSPQSPISRIAINKRGRVTFINPSDVLTVEGQGNYVRIACESGLYRLRESMSAMAEKLQPYGFVRIHRSVLVNKAWVEEICPRSPGVYLLRLRNGKKLTVTRKYKKNLKSLAELWLGKDTFSGPDI